MSVRKSLPFFLLLSVAATSLAQPDQPRVGQIEQALAQPVMLAFYKSPLEKAVADLKKMLGIEIRVGDEVKNPTRVLLSSFYMSRISLRSGLNTMLAERDLTWIVDGDALRVTTLAYARQNLKVKSYKVGNLSEDKSLQQLTSMISSLIATKKQSVTLKGGKITLAATDRQHDVVRGLLQRLLVNRRALKDAGDNKQRIKDHILLAPTDILQYAGPSQVLRIALDQESDFDFNMDPPIREAVDFLSQLHKVTIYVEPQTGLDGSERISALNQPVTFRQGLNSVLQKLKCTWIIEDELLKVISVKRSLRRPTIQVYVVADLVNDKRPVDAIAQSIRASLSQPKVPRPSDRRQTHAFQGMLIVAETGMGQHRIRQMLREMRNPKN